MDTAGSFENVCRLLSLVISTDRCLFFGQHVKSYKKTHLNRLFNPIIGSKVTAILSGESQTGWLFLVVELHRGESATIGATRTSFNIFL